MANITLKGNPITTCGELPSNGTTAANFSLVKQDLSETSLSDYRAQALILLPAKPRYVCLTRKLAV